MPCCERAKRAAPHLPGGGRRPQCSGRRLQRLRSRGGLLRAGVHAPAALGERRLGRQPVAPRGAHDQGAAALGRIVHLAQHAGRARGVRVRGGCARGVCARRVCARGIRARRVYARARRARPGLADRLDAAGACLRAGRLRGRLGSCCRPRRGGQLQRVALAQLQGQQPACNVRGRCHRPARLWAGADVLLAQVLAVLHAQSKEWHAQ